MFWTILIAYTLAGHAKHDPKFVGHYATKDECSVAAKAVKPADYPGFVMATCIVRKG